MRLLSDRPEAPTAQSVGYYPRRLSLSIKEFRLAEKEKERKNESTFDRLLRLSIQAEQTRQRYLCNLFGYLFGCQPALRAVPTR